LVGVSPLLSEEELMFLLSRRFEGSVAPTSVTVFDSCEYKGAGLAVVRYPSFVASMDAVQKLQSGS